MAEEDIQQLELDIDPGTLAVDDDGKLGVKDGVFVEEGDSRLTNPRTPTAHAGSHATGQADAITPAAIGAQSALGFTPENTGNRGAASGYAPLDSAAKVPVANLPSAIMTYKGGWNAATNSPSLADGTGTAGDTYIVSTAGTRDLGSGSIVFYAGDFVIYSGSVWQRSPSGNSVVSVNGRTGEVSIADFVEIKPYTGEGEYVSRVRAAAAVTPAVAFAPLIGLEDFSCKSEDGKSYMPSLEIDQIGTLIPGQMYWVAFTGADSIAFASSHITSLAGQTSCAALAKLDHNHDAAYDAAGAAATAESNANGYTDQQIGAIAPPAWTTLDNLTAVPKIPVAVAGPYADPAAFLAALGAALETTPSGFYYHTGEDITVGEGTIGKGAIINVVGVTYFVVNQITVVPDTVTGNYATIAALVSAMETALGEALENRVCYQFAAAITTTDESVTAVAGNIFRFVDGGEGDDSFVQQSDFAGAPSMLWAAVNVAGSASSQNDVVSGSIKCRIVDGLAEAILGQTTTSYGTGEYALCIPGAASPTHPGMYSNELAIATQAAIVYGGGAAKALWVCNGGGGGAVYSPFFVLSKAFDFTPFFFDTNLNTASFIGKIVCPVQP